MDERLAHRYHQRQFRCLAVYRHVLAHGGVADDGGGAAHAQRFRPAGDEENQPDPRVAQDVAEGVRAPVAGPLGDGECPALIQHAHETRRVTLGRNVEVAFAVGGGDQDEGPAGNEGAAQDRRSCRLPWRARAGRDDPMRPRGPSTDEMTSLNTIVIPLRLVKSGASGGLGWRERMAGWRWDSCMISSRRT